jgi:hypothetical protein
MIYELEPKLDGIFQLQPQSRSTWTHQATIKERS